MTKIKIMRVYQGIDSAVSKQAVADYFVIATIGFDANNNIFVLDVHKRRGVSFHQQIETIISKGKMWNPLRIGIESNSFQIFLSQELERLTLLPIVPVTALKDKVSRAQQMSSFTEAGRVYVAPSMTELISEFVLFPDGEHDDQVDAVSLALLVSETGQQNATANYFIPEFESDRYFNQP